jgi:hypothetical protein
LSKDFGGIISTTLVESLPLAGSHPGCVNDDPLRPARPCPRLLASRCGSAPAGAPPHQMQPRRVEFAKNDELSGRALHPGSMLKLLIAVVAVIAIGVAVYFLPSPRALSPWSEWRTKNYPSSSRTVSSER